MSDNFSLNPNKVVRYLHKAPAEFTKADIIKFIKANDIQMVTQRRAQRDVARQ